ncbi:glycosyltransferase family 9 protein [Mucilaginibacter sp.]
MHSISNKFKFLVIRKIAPTIIKAVFFFVPSRKNTLLIIKTDGIGDYILFRNFLSFLKESEKYKKYKIYLLGNNAYQDLSVHLDKYSVDAFFGYADKYFLKWKLLKLLFKLQCLRLNTIIYANYSRKAQVDWIVKYIHALNKIGIDGDTINQSAQLKLKGNAFYTRLINMPSDNLHEFERNKILFETITEQNCDYRKPFIEKQRLNIVNNDSVVVFIGASDESRKWTNKNFSDLSKRIIYDLDKNVILAGGKDEMTDSIKIQQNGATHHLINKTGQLSLVQLCELMGGAKLVVCSDTVAVHIAAALSIPAVCISRGDLFKRFIPYPDHIENKITTIFSPDFNADDATYNNWSSLNINSVLLSDVYNAVESTLKNNYSILSASS